MSTNVDAQRVLAILSELCAQLRAVSSDHPSGEAAVKLAEWKGLSPDDDEKSLRCVRELTRALKGEDPALDLDENLPSVVLLRLIEAFYKVTEHRLSLTYEEDKSCTEQVEEFSTKNETARASITALEGRLSDTKRTVEETNAANASTLNGLRDEINVMEDRYNDELRRMHDASERVRAEIDKDANSVGAEIRERIAQLEAAFQVGHFFWNFL